MKQKLLIGAVFCGSILLGAENVRAACTPSPSCTELGYTKTQSECGEDGIKCPFGNLWSCKPKPDRRCQIGWIYYADGTCSSAAAYPSSSEYALGVVVYVNPDGIGGQIMSAWPVDENGNKSNSNVSILWSTYELLNIAKLPDYVSATSAAKDYDSCGNTDKIVEFGGPTTYPAAWAARSYAPTRETKGRWCLPAAGVLNSIYNNKSAVQAGISKLGYEAVILADMFWSSSEEKDTAVWVSVSGYSYGLLNNLKTNFGSGIFVRPVLEF